MMDRHTTRDMGYLDETYLNFLKENYKVPKDLKVDFEGAPAETIYEFGGDIGRKLTDELNALTSKTAVESLSNASHKSYSDMLATVTSKLVEQYKTLSDSINNFHRIARSHTENVIEIHAKKTKSRFVFFNAILNSSIFKS